MTARDTVESTGALILARFVTPGLLAINVAVGAWIGNAVYEEIRAARSQIADIRVDQAGIKSQVIAIDGRIGGVERRVDRLEDLIRTRQP